MITISSNCENNLILLIYIKLAANRFFYNGNVIFKADNLDSELGTKWSLSND